MKKVSGSVLAAGVLAAGLVAQADVWPGDGVFTASSADDFGAADVPFVMGSGLLKWTGGSATVEKPLGFDVPGGLPATVRIVDPAATLTFAGPVTQTGGALIKDGPGTLKLASGPGTVNVVGKNRAHEDKDSYDLVWDETTGTVGDKGYATFTVNEGHVILGGPGQTNRISGVNWVGSRTQKPTRLDVVGGRLEQQNNWFCISRGAGKSDNDVTSSMYVSGGAEGAFTQLCLNNGNGVSGYYGRSLLDISDGASVTVGGDVFVGEGTGEATIRVGPGCRMTADRNGLDANQGFQVGRSGSIKADVTVDGGELSIYTGFVRAGSKLTVKNGGTLRMDRVLKHAADGNYGNGTIVVDGGTFAPRSTAYSGTMVDWFNLSGGGLDLGAGGLTLEAPGFAHLGIHPSNVVAGATITKTGAGVLTLPPSPVPVNAQAGTLRMSVSPKAWTNDLTGAISLADGASLEVSGDMALGAMPVEADAATFDAFGLERFQHWACNRNAKWRRDGVLQATEAYGSDPGSSAVFKSKVPVDRSFELAFDTFLYTTSSRPADGWSLAFHNSGTAAVGTGNTGYIGITNSFGVVVDVYNRRIQICRNGKVVKYLPMSGVVDLWGPWSQRRRCRFAYDAKAKRVAFSLRTPDGAETSWTHDVDLAAEVGADTADMAFGGGTGGSNAAFGFANIRFVEKGAPVAHVRVGGAKTLAADQTFAAKLHPNENVQGFLMGRLDYADGAAVRVEDDGAATGLAVPARLTTADQGLWTLAGGAYWRPDGSLATSRLLDGKKMNGTATAVSRIPVGGNWTCSFTYDMGAHDASPADQFSVRLLAANNAGLELACRYYEDITEISGGVTNKYNTRKTQVKLFTRGVRHPATVTDFDPIDVTKYGPTQVTMTYDDTAKTLAVGMSQQDGARSNQVVFDNVDMASVLSSNDTARVVLAGLVGGLYTENVFSDFVLRTDRQDALLASAKPVRGFFGFEKLNGSGTLVKTGAGDLGLVDTQNADVALRLAEGGLRLRREPLEDVDVRTPGGWNFSHRSGRYVYPDGIQIGESASFHCSNAQTRHQVRVDGDWRCSFSLWINGGSPADACSFFLHNDPRGNQCVGSSTAGAGFSGIAKSVAVGWYFYPHNTANFKTMTVASNGAGLPWGNAVSHDPIDLRDKNTDVVLTYAAAAKTLTVEMTQGAASFSHVFENVDVGKSVGGSYAWLGFGVGCGGAQATPRITNLRFAHLDNVDALAGSRYLASVDVTADAAVRLDTAKADGTFRLADAVALADGTALTAESVDAAATLAMGTLTLGTGSVLKGDGRTVVAPDALAGDLGALALDGAVLKVSAATAEARALKMCDVALANGAKIAAPAGGAVSLRHVTVDGVLVKGGAYSAETTAWVASGTVVLGGGTIMILR